MSVSLKFNDVNDLTTLEMYATNNNVIYIKIVEEFEQFSGKELGVSDYLKITQEQINQFAEATLDKQWIHHKVQHFAQAL